MEKCTLHRTRNGEWWVSSLWLTTLWSMARGSSPSTPSLPLTEMKMTSTRDVVIILKGPASIQKERLSFLKSREWWWKILRGLLTVVKRLSILESPRFLQVNLTVPTERSHLHSKPTCMILVCMAIFGGPFLKPTCPTPLSSCKLSKKKKKKNWLSKILVFTWF